MEQQPTDFAPTEPQGDSAFANTCPYCGDLGDFVEDDEREPLSPGEAVFLVFGYFLSAILMLIGIGATVGWMLA